MDDVPRRSSMAVLACAHRRSRKVETLRAALKTLLVIVSVSSGCAGARNEPGEASGPASKGTADASVDRAPSAASPGDAGTGGERPFAGSVAEATALISIAVDKRQGEIASCVNAFRLRKKLARERVSISFGMDQEGKLLGVTSKGKEDLELKTCVQDSLKGVLFPRSHAGVITVTKTYEELLQ